MKVTTKKTKLDKNFYIKMAMANIFKEQWWVGLIFLAICSGMFFVYSNWWWIGAVIALVLYTLFWLIQFGGITQMEQSKLFFEKLVYDITSKEIMMRIDAKQGMPIKWNMVKSATEKKGFFWLKLSKGQFVYWPFKAFKNDNEVKFVRHILTQKGYL